MFFFQPCSSFYPCAHFGPIKEPSLFDITNLCYLDAAWDVSATEGSRVSEASLIMCVHHALGTL